MERLDKAYEAINLMESIDIPISFEQKAIIGRMEREYLHEEVLPLLEEEMLPLVEKMRNKFELEVVYTHKNGLNISLVERPAIQTQLFSNDSSSKRQKKYLIRVTFPDNHVSCKQKVLETLIDVIRFAGPERVQRLGIVVMGLNLVSHELHKDQRYRVGQKEIEPGLYVGTFSSTDAKFEQIRKINRDLNLGLRIEKQML